MSKLLLDTCAVIWTILDPQALSESARSAIAASDEDISVSAISCAEIACLVERSRLTVEGHWKPWFRRHVELNCWDVLAVDLDTFEEAYSLPAPIHGDPADRILIATARLKGMSIVTADRKILDYPHVKTVW
jgi:PIN domain nuclease of toxin-antitoxin system